MLKDFFLLQKSVGSSVVLFTLLNKNSWNILQNNFFYVPKKKESHTGLERHEGEKMMIEKSFLGIYLWNDLLFFFI